MSFTLKYLHLAHTLTFDASIIVSERIREEQKESVHHYKISIGWTCHRSGWDYLLFVRKEHISSLPANASMADSLVQELGLPANYLELTLKKGVPQKLANKETIIQDWHEKAAQLQHTYQGDWAEAVIQKATGIYKQEETIVDHFIKKDWPICRLP